MAKESFGDLIKAQRRKLKFDQRTLAKLSGLQQAKISQIENGLHATAREAWALGLGLGIPVEDVASHTGYAVEVLEAAAGGGCQHDDPLEEVEHGLLRGHWPKEVRAALLALSAVTQPTGNLRSWAAAVHEARASGDTATLAELTDMVRAAGPGDPLTFDRSVKQALWFVDHAVAPDDTEPPGVIINQLLPEGEWTPETRAHAMSEALNLRTIMPSTWETRFREMVEGVLETHAASSGPPVDQSQRESRLIAGLRAQTEAALEEWREANRRVDKLDT